jgi:two-component system sensor histidine kinase SenX3
VLGARRKSVAVFITLGACSVALAVALNVSFIVLNWRTGVMLALGILFFGLIIAGVVLNTIFLVREIRRNEQHDQFINSVTHELKTPVSSIQLYLETLKTRQMDEAKRLHFYDVMLADTHRLSQTIEQVLRAGQAKLPHSQINRVVLDLGELVSGCVDLALLRHHLPAEAIQYRALSAMVLGDPEDLKAAVSNLIDNAIKYSQTEVCVKVEVAKPDAKHVAVRVKDSGVGISAAELGRIFKRFYRVPGTVTMRVKGTGLGLFIVNAAAKKHGGRAFAESEGPGRGSTFTLQLPSA